MTAPQWQQALKFLHRNPKRTATIIARKLGVKLASMSSVLNRLTEASLIKREKGGPRGGYIYELGTCHFPLVDETGNLTEEYLGWADMLYRTQIKLERQRARRA